MLQMLCRIPYVDCRAEFLRAELWATLFTAVASPVAVVAVNAAVVSLITAVEERAVWKGWKEK